jgi:hypothetical protein
MATHGLIGMNSNIYPVVVSPTSVDNCEDKGLFSLSRGKDKKRLPTLWFPKLHRAEKTTFHRI